MELCCGARRAVVAAPTVCDVRNALAPCRVFARLFALLEVQAFPWRVLHIFLTGVRVAFGKDTDLDPCTFHICWGRECRDYYNWYCINIIIL